MASDTVQFREESKEGGMFLDAVLVGGGGRPSDGVVGKASEGRCLSRDRRDRK